MNQSPFSHRRLFARGLVVWGTSGLVVFSVYLALFTAFLGRSVRVQNRSLHGNHRFVGAPGSVEIHSTEGYGRTSFGADGQVVDKRLRADRPRIVFMGDSFLEARQVDDDDKFTQLVERNWNEQHPIRPIETVNLGLYGLDTSEWATMAPRVDRLFAPALVFLLMAWNDFESPEEFERNTRLFARDAPPAGGMLDWINRSGSAPFFLKLRIQARDLLKQNQFLRGVTAPAAATGSQGEPEPAGTEPVVEYQLAPLRATFGARLVVIYNSAPWNLGRAARRDVDREILAELARLEIPVIDLFEDFGQAIRRRDPPQGFHNSMLGQGHWNQLGHRIVADRVRDYLEKRHDLFQP